MSRRRSCRGTLGFYLIQEILAAAFDEWEEPDISFARAFLNTALGTD
jgi:hypothetical protein